MNLSCGAPLAGEGRVSSWPAGAEAPLDLAKASDSVLARALIMRSPRAARVAWRRFAPLVSQILARALGADEIDDAMQNVFLRVFAKMPELRRPESLRAFIVSVAIRCTRHEIRRRRKQRRLSLVDSVEAADPRSVTLDTDSREALARFSRVLERMKAKDRTVFVLHVIEGVNVLDIARTLKCSEPTIRRHLARSRACAVRHAVRDQVLVSYVPLGARTQP